MTVSIRDIPLALWVVALFLSPFYLFPSGLPQPGDVVMALSALAALLFASGRLSSSAVAAVVATGGFFAWAIMVNLVWALARQGTSFLMIALFLSFNAMVLLTTIVLGSQGPERLLAIAARVSAATLVSQLAVAAVIGRADRLRGTLLFNNPNQLGYFALLCGAVFLVSRRFGNLPRVVEVAAGGAIFILAGLSLSKAAMLGAALLLMIEASRWHLRRLLLLGVIAGAVGGLGIATFGRELVLLNDVASRLQSLGADGDDNFEGRGYGRIFRNPGMLVLGAGESENTRWEVTRYMEIHSTWGTLVFSYGIVGVVLFGLLCFVVMRGVPWREGALILPAAIYGLAHNGLREPLFWTFLGLLFAVSVVHRRSNPMRDSSQQVLTGGHV